jgi:hypothetical protein
MDGTIIKFSVFAMPRSFDGTINGAIDFNPGQPRQAR